MMHSVYVNLTKALGPRATLRVMHRWPARIKPGLMYFKLPNAHAQISNTARAKTHSMTWQKAAPLEI